MKIIIFILVIFAVYARTAELFSDTQTPNIDNTIVIPDDTEPKPNPVPNNKLPDFVDIKQYRDVGQNTIYSDVLNHSKDEPFKDSARSTTTHETAHGIHSDLRNEYRQHNANGFYALNGRGIILKQPNMRLRDVALFIPQELRSYRYELYFVRQLGDWDDTPTYALEEWVCYILGGSCALEDFKNHLPKENSDCVSGCLDFSIYAIATYLAAKDKDPEYVKNYPQFKNMIQYYLNMAEKTFLDGKDIFVSVSQEKLYASFITSENAKTIRDCMKNEFNITFIRK